MYIAIYDKTGKQVVELVTVDEWLSRPWGDISEPCGNLELI